MTKYKTGIEELSINKISYGIRVGKLMKKIVRALFLFHVSKNSHKGVL
jgi:hypothetical protein